MARYRVVQSGPKWIVKRNGRRRFQKEYQTKSAALSAARRDANEGDSVQGQKLSGEWDTERTKGVFGPQGDQ